MKDYLSVEQLAKICGVCIKTLHRWERNGQLTVSYRTKGGHRRYSLQVANDIQGLEPNNEDKTAVLYARVSSSDQKQDLARQGQRLKDYATGPNFKNTITICDVGSGMNFNKKGLLSLLKLLFTGSVNKIIVTHKDRLMRFGFALIEKICQYLNVDILGIQSQDKERDFTAQLTQDLIEIITVFSAKLYGRRSAQNRVKLQIPSQSPQLKA